MTERNEIDPLFDRKSKLYSFRSAIREMLSTEERIRLETEWYVTEPRKLFGYFLYTRHPEIFARAVAWMKVTGNW